MFARLVAEILLHLVAAKASSRIILILKMIAFWDIAPCRLFEVDFSPVAFFRPDDGGSTHL
jgi:hypothetical protein